MSHTPHELDEVFAGQEAQLNALKAQNTHFARLSDEYHRLNRQIHRAETDIEPMADHVLEDLKKRRLALLDEIREMLGPV